mgnify:CR=1 FL=1
MIKTEYVLYIVILFFTCCTSCTDIIEPNITDERVVLLAPADKMETIYAAQTFWWEELQSTNSYSLQIVTPGFDYIERLILDTIIENNKFSISLFPGDYQWRVKGINYSYHTAYSTFTLTIDSTLDLGQQLVVLVSPINMDTTNVSNQELKWEKLYNANKYVISIKDPNGTTLFDTISLNSYLMEVSLDGNYDWKVKAVNNYSETVFFQRSFYYSSRTLSAPLLLTPANESIYNTADNIHFSWERDNVTIPSIKDSIYISSDSLFSNIVFKSYLNLPSYESNFEQGRYYWRVKSIDKAGNKSDFSQTSVFHIYN